MIPSRMMRANIAAILILVLILDAFRHFLNFVEARKGVVLNDPILATLPPHNLTILIFVLIYGSLFLGIVGLSRDPKGLFTAVQAYAWLILFRIIAMYLMPLSPPEGMIPLHDPVVEIFGKGQVLTQDLFFSGHTALLFLLALTARTKPYQIIFYLGTAAVGVSLMIQHVHYSIDVFAAPFFAFAAVSVSRQIGRLFLIK